ncbi:hypothetical protein, partial [Paenibacillus tyrfis]|uniref:hypothetical protein n=1 Tax=Paenibacillus tyrfis TaxID=1501230 RepID=UPI001C6FC86A
MNKQRSKQREATFFYGKMIESKSSGNYEELKFYISAFVNAARTIQQFTYKDAESRGKEAEYQELMNDRPIFRFFTKIRNYSIHEKLIETSRIGSSSISAGFIIKRPETTNEQLDASQKEAEARKMDTIKNEVHYYFDEWDGEEDCFTLAEQ